MNTVALYKGLDADEVASRVATGQVNVSQDRTSRSALDILRANLFTRFNALLGVLLVAVLLVGSPADALFGGAVFINSAIGIIQELRAKRTLDRLAILNTPLAHVIRGSKLRAIPIPDIVLGDLLKLQVGDQVPADGKLLSVEGLEIDESLLSGESEALVKQPGDKVLSGSMVVAGVGYAETTAVGANAYAHTITTQVKRFTRARSELVEGTNKLLRYISWILVVVAPILVWGQLTRSGSDWQEAIVRSTAAIVGMIPEGLVLLTSLAFMLATLNLARRKVLVQQLAAVEGLARVDVICLDKTGTLTEGAIAFEELCMLDASQQGRAESALATFAAEPNSPTLQALHESFNTTPLKTVASVPFSSSRKWSAISLSKSETWVMGAPEFVLPDSATKARQQAATIAQNGKRVLVLLRAAKTPATNRDLPVDCQAIALIVLREKVRPDAAKTLEFFADQGVQLKIISGDNPLTVSAVARAVGLPDEDPIDARTLPTNAKALATILETHSIFGRVLPEQKRAIVIALQAQGHVVAMTGDGVNDALALKDADIGIAMGNGAQATKAIAELVLLDNQFANMPRVLAEGRRVIANIERVASLFLIKNVYSLLLSIIVTVAALSYPFLPRHMTTISLLTIGIPAFFLALAPNKQRYIPGFLRRVLLLATPTGIVIALLIFISYLVLDRQGVNTAVMSTALTGIVMVMGIAVLVRLAQPLRTWKITLIGLMAAGFVGLIVLPFSRELLGFSIDTARLGLSLGLSLAGVLLLTVLWRFEHMITKRRNNI